MQIIKANGSYTISNDTFQIVIDDHYSHAGFDVPDIIVQPSQGKVEITMVSNITETAKKISEIVTFFESWKPEIIKKTAKNVYDLIANYCHDWLLDEQAKAIQGDDLETELSIIHNIQDSYDTQRLIVQSLKQQIKHVQLQRSFYEQKMKKCIEPHAGLGSQTTLLFEEFKRQHELFSEISQRITLLQGQTAKKRTTLTLMQRKISRYRTATNLLVGGTLKEKNKSERFIEKINKNYDYNNMQQSYDALLNEYNDEIGLIDQLKNERNVIYEAVMEAQKNYVLNDSSCFQKQKKITENNIYIQLLNETINELNLNACMQQLQDLLCFNQALFYKKMISLSKKEIIQWQKLIEQEKNKIEISKGIKLTTINRYNDEIEKINNKLYGQANDGKGLYQDLNNLLLHNEHTSGITYFKEVQCYQDMINNDSWKTDDKEMNIFLKKGFEKLKFKKIHTHKNEVAALRDQIKKIVGYKKEVEQLQQVNERVISSAVKNLDTNNSNGNEIEYDLDSLQKSHKQLSDQKESLKKQLSTEMEKLQGLEWNILDEKRGFAHTIALYLRKKKEFEEKLNNYEIQWKQIIKEQDQLVTKMKKDKQKSQQEKDKMEYKKDQKEDESDEDYSERKQTTLSKLQGDIQKNEKQRVSNKNELKKIRKKGHGVLSLYTLFLSQIKEYKKTLIDGVCDQEIIDLFDEIDTELTKYGFLETIELRKRKKTGLPPLVRQGMAGGHRSMQDYDNKVSTGLRKNNKK